MSKLSSRPRLLALSLALGLLVAAAPARADIHIVPNENGALSGKTVVFSPGHGRFNDGGTLRFQRGVTHDLREDIHTNEIFIEYVQRYLANAGARVESVRERSFQTHEVIVDNDDPGYSETGPWTSSTSAPKYFESGYRYAPVSASGGAVATFTPDLPAAGRYPVYVWFTTSSNRATAARYTIHHSGGATTVRVDQSDLGDHWLFLGDFHFPAGTSGRVELSSEGQESGKFVIADAVRFGGGIGPSGLPRWQEAAAMFLPFKGFSAPNGDVTIRPVYARWLAGGDLSSWRDDFIYFALHTNASGSTSATANGLSTFSYSNGRSPAWGSAGAAHYPTSPSALDAASDAYRDRVQSEVLGQIRGTLEPGWRDRGAMRMNFGELRECRNMRSCLIELGFHDNVSDAKLLGSDEFRALAARGIYKGIVKSFNPSATIVPLPPEALRVENLGGGRVRIAWRSVLDPLESSAAPTAFKVYLSTDGLGFDNGRVVQGESLELSGLGAGETVFVRVAALNAGGESLPTRVGAARVGAPGGALIVDGFDRPFTHTHDNIAGRFPADLVIEHVDAIGFALPATGINYAANEAVIAGDVRLTDHPFVDWLLGREGSVTRTFDVDEQALVDAYLAIGGALFASGTEIGWDLEARSGGMSFFHDKLGAEYVQDDAGTFTVMPSASGGPFSSLGALTLDDGTLGRYGAFSTDVLQPRPGSMAVLRYAGPNGMIAGIARDGLERVVLLGFPFETVSGRDARRELMVEVTEFLIPGLSAAPGSGGSGGAPVAAAPAGSGGGGGGGCSVASGAGTSDAPSAPLWMLVVLALVILRRRA